MAGFGRPGGRPGHAVNQGLRAANRENPVLDFIVEFQGLANLFRGAHTPETKTAEGAGTRLDSIQSLDILGFYPPHARCASLAEMVR